ncbi:hypothetical protein CKO_01607 [Citrobacter koseri ATCC BAA-895]|uniref:Uncharacterized protein n=1 Tax=Citrobacter koseri (strain ATCC BAA-895 / CDC 4225-83 / SGSC4696) TaxID=290338 RepID=A8AGX6_CITK8|nr:hypothetical protein CKO_01607 [Citrobacter koseri ATCC BAA-895]
MSSTGATRFSPLLLPDLALCAWLIHFIFWFAAYSRPEGLYSQAGEAPCFTGFY